MIRFYKTIAKIVRTLKSYLTGAVLKMRYSFSYNYILCYLAKGFRKFFTTKAGKSKEARVKTRLVCDSKGRLCYQWSNEFAKYLKDYHTSS